MKHLIIKRKPVPNIMSLEIFEPQVNDDNEMVYPVSIDGKYMMFKKEEENKWSTKGMASFVEPTVIQYVIDLIEGHKK